MADGNRPLVERTSTSRNTAILAQTADDEAISTQSLAEKSLKNGRQWIVRDNFTLGDGEEVEVIIALPEEADDAIRVVDRAITPDDAVDGEVTFNREIDTAGTDLSVVNARINGDVAESIPDVSVESSGNYINPVERNGSVIELPVRSALGVSPPGPTRGRTEKPGGALYQILPGGSIHYRIESTEANNTVEFQFLISQREATNATE